MTDPIPTTPEPEYDSVEWHQREQAEVLAEPTPPTLDLDSALPFTPPGVEDIEASRTEPSTPITGGYGENMNAPRRLVVMVELPDRRDMTFQARNLLLDSDIREAMAKGAVRLHNHYLSRYSVLGFVFNPDDIEYDITRLQLGMDIGADTAIKHTEGLARVLVATILIRR